MANTLNLGSGNWGAKDSLLLGYYEDGGKFFPETFDVTRATVGTRVNKNGLIETPTEILSGELITNGDFDTDSDWFKGSGWTISGGKASCDGVSSNSSLYQIGIGVNGDTYKISGTISDYVSGTLQVGGSSRFLQVNTNGDFVHYREWTADPTLYLRSVNFIGSIDNVSVVEVNQKNLARIDYTDSTKGVLLTEPQSTNLLAYSEGFSQWSFPSATTTITSNDTISPDGTQSADTMGITTSNTYIYESVTASASTEYTFSFYVKRGTLAESSLKLAIYDGSNASFIVSDVSYAASDSEWNRISQSFTTPVGCTSVRVYPFRNTSTTSGTISFWGAQLEAENALGYNGEYATSYIPTEGSTATRNAELVTNGGDVNSFNSKEGVLYAEISTLANLTPNYQLISLSDGTNNNRCYIGFTPLSNEIAGTVVVGGSNQVSFFYETSDTTKFQKVAIKYKQNDTSLWVNGIEVLTDTNCNTFSANTLNACKFTSSGLSSVFFGKTKNVQVFNEALSDSDLLSLTTTGSVPYWRQYSAMATTLNYTNK